MSKIFNQSGGYRKLHTFNFATIIHLGTISFCKRFLSWKDDPLGKTLGQMVGASRSGKQNLVEFDYTEDLLHDYWTFLLKQKRKFDRWLEDQDDIAAANALIILIQRATGLIGRQLTRLESDFLQSGGIREKMMSARLEARAEPEDPSCPECGAAMRRRTSARGPFWGCSAYPQCKGIRRMEA